MYRQLIVLIIVALLFTGCGDDVDSGATDTMRSEQSAASSAPRRERGGSITVGEESWKIVPSMQCSVYPGNVVAIAGHAESDAELEIVIDHDPNGRSGVRVGSDRGDAGWYSIGESLKWNIDGNRVSVSGNFSTSMGGWGETAAGEFTVEC